MTQTSTLPHGDMGMWARRSQVIPFPLSEALVMKVCTPGALTLVPVELSRVWAQLSAEADDALDQGTAILMSSLAWFPWAGHFPVPPRSSLMGQTGKNSWNQ